MVGWLFLAIAAAILLGVTRLVYRAVVKDAPVFAFTIALHLFGGLFALPFFLANMTFPSEAVAWVLFSISALIWTGSMLLFALSLKHTHASIREPIAQTQLLWSVLLAFVLLHETFTFSRFIGALCIVAGAVLVSIAHITQRSGIRRGIMFTLITALAWSFASIVDKSAMTYFTPVVYNFLEYAVIFLILFIVLLFLNKKHHHETIAFITTRWRVMILCGILTTSVYFLSLSVLRQADASLAFPLMQSGSVITIIGGILIFREERVHIVRKLFAAALVVAGAVLVVQGA